MARSGADFPSSQDIMNNCDFDTQRIDSATGNLRLDIPLLSMKVKFQNVEGIHFLKHYYSIDHKKMLWLGFDEEHKYMGYPSWVMIINESSAFVYSEHASLTYSAVIYSYEFASDKALCVISEQPYLRQLTNQSSRPPSAAAD